MAEAITLRIITPESIVLDTTASSVRIPGTDGQLGVLPKHASMVAALSAGELFYTEGGKEHCRFIGAGFAEVRQDTIRIVSDSCERPSDIDVERAVGAAERSKDRLKARKTEGGEVFDHVRAEASLRRALLRKLAAKRRSD